MRKSYKSAFSDSTHHYDDSYQTHIILAKRLHTQFSDSLDYEEDKTTTTTTTTTNERYLTQLNKFELEFECLV